MAIFSLKKNDILSTPGSRLSLTIDSHIIQIRLLARIEPLSYKWRRISLDRSTK